MLNAVEQIFYIIAETCRLFDSPDTTRLLEQIKKHRSTLDERLQGFGPDLSSEERWNYVRILEALLKEDPEERLAIQDLARDEWLMQP